MLEYILFKYRERDSKHHKHLSVLREKKVGVYRYYVIDNDIHFNKKKITKNIIRYLTEWSLISDKGYFINDVHFLDFKLGRWFFDVGVVYRYEIL